MTAAAARAEPEVISPQPGFQTRFLSSGADITIGGGAAGCGKTAAEIIAPIAFVDLPEFRATVFRRNTTSLRAGGGAWDESQKFYPHLGAKPNGSELYWQFPSGARVKMAHLEYDSTVYDYKSAQIPLIIFDELTEFSAFQFWYMASRNRSTCGIKPYILAGTNPDADSWVADVIAWWIDQDEFLPGGEPNPRYGFAIADRAGVLRYFTRVGDELIWGDTPAEVAEHPSVRADVETLMAEAAERGEPTTFERVVDDVVQSLTYIPGKLSENRVLERADPKYRGKLMAMTRVERARLLDGNWKVKATTGDYFKRSEVTMLDFDPPDDEIAAIWRAWDLAATEVSESNKDPDYTAGVKMGRLKNGRYFVSNAIIVRRRSDEVRQLVRRTAENDGHKVKIALFQDPGQAGKDQAQSYIKLLAGFTVSAEPVTGDKETNAEPLSAQWQAGNVYVVSGEWNQLYFALMEGFPSKDVHDDPVDASSRAFKKCVNSRSMFDLY